MHKSSFKLLFCAGLAAVGQAQHMMSDLIEMGMNMEMRGNHESNGEIESGPEEGTEIPFTVIELSGKDSLGDLQSPLPFEFPELPFPFPGLPQLSKDFSELEEDAQIVSVPIAFPFAPPDYALYRNCHEDRERFCAFVPPPYSVESLFNEKCFTENAEKLSNACREMLGAFHEGPDVFDRHVVSGLVGNCQKDKEHFCGETSVADSPWQLFTASCMAMNRDRLSLDCQRDFDSFTAAHTNDVMPPNYVPKVHVEIIRLPINGKDSGDILVDIVDDGKDRAKAAQVGGESILFVDETDGDDQLDDMEDSNVSEIIVKITEDPVEEDESNDGADIIITNIVEVDNVSSSEEMTLDEKVEKIPENQASNNKPAAEKSIEANAQLSSSAPSEHSSAVMSVVLVSSFTIAFVAAMLAFVKTHRARQLSLRRNRFESSKMRLVSENP